MRTGTVKIVHFDRQFDLFDKLHKRKPIKSRTVMARGYDGWYDLNDSGHPTDSTDDLLELIYRLRDDGIINDREEVELMMDAMLGCKEVDNGQD